MARGLQGVMLRGLGARDHKATVVETVFLGPHFVRVRMESSTLFDDVKAEPAAWLRFWFPDPDGSNTEFQRAYTISEADVPAGRFAVDMVLHEPAGPASRWARTVQPGTTIAVTSLMGSARFDVPDPQPAGYLLIGDSASIPAINGIVGVVPDGVPIELYLEQHSDDDTLIPLARHPRLALHWVARRDENPLAAEAFRARGVERQHVTDVGRLPLGRPDRVAGVGAIRSGWTFRASRSHARMKPRPRGSVTWRR
ncbi:ABC transporter ATP-binding protein [Mycobacterium bohemicum DSM 44277]|uniref:ABC transporter ATP-binding protein n=1 Tax=Mycobacterium bohemicum DSM 44277 TaxID=1236609 RepID=A0A0U0W720_MYCBE|nr:ABC transporter ATP-binding protein [Mycobacterium bohemicum DSM 44277]